jgi:hypothetical protein
MNSFFSQQHLWHIFALPNPLRFVQPPHTHTTTDGMELLPPEGGAEAQEGEEYFDDFEDDTPPLIITRPTTSNDAHALLQLPPQEDNQHHHPQERRKKKTETTIVAQSSGTKPVKGRKDRGLIRRIGGGCRGMCCYGSQALISTPPPLPPLYRTQAPGKKNKGERRMILGAEDREEDEEDQESDREDEDEDEERMSMTGTSRSSGKARHG